MRDAHDATSPSLLSRLAATWRYLTYLVQADFVGIAPAKESADREEEKRKAEQRDEDNQFANYYRWMLH